MLRFKLAPSTIFKLFVAAVAFALGLAAAGLWPRQGAGRPAPHAAAAPARAEVSVRDTFETAPGKIPKGPCLQPLR